MLIHRLKLPIANAYLVDTGQHLLLVDCGMPNDFNRLVAKIEALGYHPYDIDYILLTHGHVDHCGTAAQFVQQYNLTTVIHKDDAHLVLAGQNGELQTTNFVSKMVKRFIVKPFPAFKPGITLDAADDLDALLPEVRCFHLPGHTKGSIGFLFQNGKMIVGDTLMGGFLGGALFPSRPQYHYFINEPIRLKDSIKAILKTGAQQILPGHGNVLKAVNVRKLRI
jgi:hydroxyacylglutathione hydrolase